MSSKLNQRTDAEIIDEIKDVIETIRMFVKQDGGDLEFVSYKKGVVEIKLLAACIGCSLIDMTYKDGVENILQDQIPEVEELIIVNKFK